jgi:hypothetical protein
MLTGSLVAAVRLGALITQAQGLGHRRRGQGGSARGWGLVWL